MWQNQHVVEKDFAAGTCGAVGEHNLRTLVGTSVGVWERPAMTAPLAFLRYQRELGAARTALSDDHVFVALIDSGGENNRIATLAPGESLILGRHKNCDLHVDQPNMALRQTALHIGHGSTGAAPFIRVWDLHTGKTLSCENGQALESLASDGPVFLSLGRYHLALIPLGQLPHTLALGTSEAWAALPQRAFLTVMAEGTASRLVSQSDPTSIVSSITKLPSSIDLAALEATPVPSEAAVGSIIIQGPRKTREFRLGIEHLERGILIGRYGRCLGRGLDATVSRVHLMLASVGGEIVAIDTASTAGSKLGSEPFRTHRLERESKLWLGKHSYLIWHQAAIGAA